MKEHDTTTFMLDRKNEVLARALAFFEETRDATFEALGTDKKSLSWLMQWDITGLVYLEHLAEQASFLKLVMERDGIEEGMRIMLPELERNAMSYAENPPHSTSPESNRVKEMEIKAEVELLKRIKRVLSQIATWNKKQDKDKIESVE